ncbi:unnamed protein product [Gemmata massiliana]|uniref:Uncharacterized protein n=1 Tax=Gemmata massiliana TaxID=1210884 RepID=A0A6P2D209_9BACT|nr:hypothetical protein [Gemmata massiliana]VTR94887.1 unnamed protein product [Gemmata massiliana]
MLAFIVTLRSGRRYTVQAEELRCTGCHLELVVAEPPASPNPRVVGLFDQNEVVAVVAREHLVSEEPSDVVPHAVSRVDPIPF